MDSVARLFAELLMGSATCLFDVLLVGSAVRLFAGPPCEPCGAPLRRAPRGLRSSSWAPQRASCQAFMGSTARLLDEPPGGSAVRLFAELQVGSAARLFIELLRVPRRAASPGSSWALRRASWTSSSWALRRASSSQAPHGPRSAPLRRAPRGHRGALFAKLLVGSAVRLCQ